MKNKDNLGKKLLHHTEPLHLAHPAEKGFVEPAPSFQETCQPQMWCFKFFPVVKNPSGLGGRGVSGSTLSIKCLLQAVNNFQHKNNKNNKHTHKKTHKEKTEGRKPSKIITHWASLEAADCFTSLPRLHASTQDFYLVTGKIINAYPLLKFSDNNELVNIYRKSHGTLGIPKDSGKRHIL